MINDEDTPAVPLCEERPRRRASIQFGATTSLCENYEYGENAKNNSSSSSSNNNNVNFNGRPQRRRSIQFAQMDDVQEVEPMKNLTHKPEDLWYQPEEIRSIQNKNKQIVEKKQNGCEATTRELCTRGLESSFCPGKRYKKQLRIWESIKDLQNFQKKRGIYDDEVISRVYRRTSEEDMREAAQRASEDAEHILKQQRERERPSRRRSCAY
jgi:hypothetical protein